MNTKTCARCGETKSVDDFFRNRARADGYQTYCKPCVLAYNRSQHQKPKVAAGHRRRLLMNKYGITPEQYDAMLEAQGGACAICGGQNADERSLHVDHDHAVPEGEPIVVRGLLCSTCNKGLGSFKDDTGLLLAATSYLERHIR